MHVIVQQGSHLSSDNQQQPRGSSTSAAMPPPRQSSEVDASSSLQQQQQQQPSSASDNALMMLTLYLSAIVHDYDHRGVTNAFLIQDEDPLAVSTKFSFRDFYCL